MPGIAITTTTLSRRQTSRTFSFVLVLMWRFMAVPFIALHAVREDRTHTFADLDTRKAGQLPSTAQIIKAFDPCQPVVGPGTGSFFSASFARITGIGVRTEKNVPVPFG
jgi:hypothetical protein